MEGIDDNDFSDLYADVEAQASSAISALHRLTEMPPEDDGISDSPVGGDQPEGGRFAGAEMPKAGFYDRVAGGGLTKLPMDDGDFEFGAANMRENVNETFVYGGDYTSKRKNLKCDSKKRIYRVAKNVVADDDNGRDLYSGKASEDSRPISESNGRGNMALRRQSHVYGSMHTFDSVEDRRHEVSECDSDGTPENTKTPYNNNSKNTSNTSSSVPSSVSSESSQSRLSSHHGPSSSCSPSPTRPKIISSSSVHDPRRRRPSTGPGKYCEKQRIPARKDINQHMKSNVAPDWKGHLIHKDGSYVTDSRRPYGRHTRHEKERTLLNFDYNDKHRPYCRSDSRNTLKRSRETDYDALEDGWHNNGERVITPKYPAAVGTRGTQLFNRRYMQSGNRHKDQLDRNIARDRREMDSSEQGKRWHDNTFGISHKLRYIEKCGSPERKMRRTWKEMGRGSSQYGNVQRNMTGHHDWGNTLGISHNLRYIETGRTRERNMRCTWKEMGIGNGQYGNVRRNMTGHHDWGNTLGISHNLRYIETGGTPERNMRCMWKDTSMGNGQYGNVRNMSGQHDWGNSLRRRHHQRFKVLHSRDQVYKDNYFERISSNNRRAFGDVAELIDERGVDRRRYKMKRDERSYQSDGCHKFIHHRSCMDVPQRYRESVEPPMDIEGKERKAETGNDRYHGSHDLGECNDNWKHTKEDSDDFKPENDVLLNEGNINDFLDIEEGQIITEEVGEDTNNGVGKGLDDEKIREIMAKMEERRERFKVPPIDSSRESEKTSNRLLDLGAESAEKGKVERPTRKRRWF